MERNSDDGSTGYLLLIGLFLIECGIGSIFGWGAFFMTLGVSFLVCSYAVFVTER